MPIYHYQYYVGNLGHIDHAGKGVGRTFDKGKAPPFGSNDSDGPARRGEVMFSVALDEGLDEG